MQFSAFICSIVIFVRMIQRIGTALLVLFFIVQCSGIKQRQEAKRLVKRQADTMQHPYWIDMMDDTNSLYNSTLSAFNLYWKNKKRPVRDSDNEGQNLFGTNQDDNLGNLDQVFNYKRFLNWKQKSQYMIKPNGKVMTAYDILTIWKQEQTDSL